MTVLTIKGADEFFSELRDKVSALEDMSQTDVLSAKVAVARMKKYLADPTQQIKLHDLIVSETEKAYAVVTGPRFPILVPQLSDSDIRQWIKGYEAAIETLLRLMICGAYWGEEQHDSELFRSFKRITDQNPIRTLHTVDLIPLRMYPALVLLYGMGLAALSRHNYRFLRQLLRLKVKCNASRPEKSVAEAISDQAVMDRHVQRQVFENRRVPMSDHLFQVLRDPLREYISSDNEYDQIFDWFEYLVCLCHCDAQVSWTQLAQLKAEKLDFTLWASVGRFNWKNPQEGELSIIAETMIRECEPIPEKVAAALSAGFFESADHNHNKFLLVKAAFDRGAVQIRYERY